MRKYKWIFVNVLFFVEINVSMYAGEFNLKEKAQTKNSIALIMKYVMQIHITTEQDAPDNITCY